jgi:GT2 family glycosyltransferase
MQVKPNAGTLRGAECREASANLGIITVNWNGWADTLECLEAIFRMRDFHGPVIVVDNGSLDDSIDMLLAWAAGRVCILPQNREAQIERLVIPPITKPILARILEPSALFVGRPICESPCRLYIVRAGANLGFAGANNLGIRVLLKSEYIDLFWFINNDALPREDALNEMMRAACPMSAPLIFGSALIEYWEPSIIQAVGARYSLYLGTSADIMAGMHIDSLSTLGDRISVDYPIGAAMLVNRAFITDYGLMREDYFLYCEEIDWVLRMGWPSKARGIPRSIVFHKGGSTTAAGRKGIDRNLLSDYYILRNRLLLARRVSMAAYLCCVLLAPVLIVRRMIRNRKGLVLNSIRALRDGMIGRSGKRRA